MRFAKEGYRVAAIPALLGAALGLFAGWQWAAPVLLLALAALLFFRDPERRPAAGADADSVLCPADGRVIVVDTKAAGHRFAPAATTRISIFMSPLDVHINRMPVAGVVERIEHRTGRFSAAYSADASEVNESNSLLVRAAAGYELVVVQIAGWLARRIVCHIGEGATVASGQRFGLIMFGSRVDVFLPEGAAPAVTVGQRVHAGATVIARAPAAE